MMRRNDKLTIWSAGDWVALGISLGTLFALLWALWQ